MTSREDHLFSNLVKFTCSLGLLVFNLEFVNGISNFNEILYGKGSEEELKLEPRGVFFLHVFLIFSINYEKTHLQPQATTITVMTFPCL